MCDVRDKRRRHLDELDDVSGEPLPVRPESAGCVSEVTGYEKEVGQMFNDANKALTKAVNERINSESYKNSQRLDGIPRH